VRAGLVNAITLATTTLFIAKLGAITKLNPEI
jgi:hypothetical protein